MKGLLSCFAIPIFGSAFQGKRRTVNKARKGIRIGRASSFPGTNAAFVSLMPGYRVVFAPTGESLKSAAPRTVPFRPAHRQEDKSPVLFEVKAGGMPDSGRRLASLPAIRHCREV